MEFPIHVFYEVDNFYQNHNKFKRDRCATELMGDEDYSDRDFCSTTCSHFLDESEFDSSSTKTFYPCGLIVHTMFDDDFEVVAAAGSQADAVTHGGVSMSETGIAWKSDMDKLFKNRAGYPADRDTNKEVYLDESLSSIDQTEYIENEHLAVWSRVAALPKFVKRFGTLTSTSSTKAAKGSTIAFKVTSRFRVASYGGKKSIGISTDHWVGSRNFFLGTAYMSFGAACWTIAIFFALKETFLPRPLPHEVTDGDDEELNGDDANKPGPAEIAPEP